MIRGSLQTRFRRVTDILNQADEPFLVLSDVTTDEFGTKGETIKAEYAQVNLGSVLFAVADDIVEPAPELRTPKSPEEARISIPPFKVVGKVHLLPVPDLREALTELMGSFIPITEATYWSDSLGEARQSSQLVAINHGRAQILAPHRVVDPWAGLGGSAGASASTRAATDEATSTADAAPETPAPTTEELGW